MKFAYFGTPYVARDTLAQLVDAGYTPTVVVTSPDAQHGRGMELRPCETKVWALDHDLPVHTPSKIDGEFLKELSSYDCDLAIVVAYGKLLPQTAIDLFPRGILNIHYSLLPLYRGASPVESALRNGDTVTGVTIQQMALEMDAGDILAQEEVAIAPTDTTLTLRPKLIEAGADLLIRMLPAVEAGTLTPVAQDAARATRAPKIRKEEGLLSLSNDAVTNWNTYRAFRESPGTYFYANKDDKRIRVKIVDAEFASGVLPAFRPTRIVPEGKPEQSFTYLSQNGWSPE